MSGPSVKCRLDLGRRTVRHVAAPARSSAAPTTPVTTAARTLALAHFIEREVRAGRWTSYRDAARAIGLSHARIQHVVGLLFLPAPVQADVLADIGAWSERALRRAASLSQWPAAGAPVGQ